MKIKNISMIILVYILASYVIRLFLNAGSSFNILIVQGIPLIVLSIYIRNCIKNKKDKKFIILLMFFLLAVSFLSFITLGNVFFPDYVHNSVVIDFLFIATGVSFLIALFIGFQYFLNTK